MNPDPLESCPYDEAHRILRSRMQWHLTRCAKNYPNAKKRQCPYDSRHHVDDIVYDYHIKHCQAKGGLVDHYNLNDREAQEEAQCLPTEVAEPANDWGTGSWNLDPAVSSYDPMQNIEERKVVYSQIGLSKAKRKAHRLNERRRYNQLQNESEQQNNNNNNTGKEDIRQPRENPRALTVQNDLTSEQDEKTSESSSRPKNNQRENVNSNINENIPIVENPDFILVEKKSNKNVTMAPKLDKPVQNPQPSVPFSYAAALNKTSARKNEKENAHISSYLNKTTNYDIKLVSLSKQIETMSVNDNIREKKPEPSGWEMPKSVSSKKNKSRK